MTRTPQLPFVRNANGVDTPLWPGIVDIPYTGGNIFHVKPYTGSDVNNSGKNPEQAFKSLRRALGACVPNQNDIVLFYGEGNASARCTDYQSAQLDWNKDLVHLIGVNSGVNISPRSRIAPVAAYADAAPIFKLSANGCLIKGVSIYMGVADTDPLGAAEITGDRNRIVNSHIIGMGALTNDVAGAYSLYLNGCEENVIENCTIGGDRTILGAAANSQILVGNLAVNNEIRNSIIKLHTAHATNTVFLRAGADSLDGALVFRNTQGINSKRNPGTDLTYAMVVASDAGGIVLVDPASFFQAADVNSTDAGTVFGNGASAGIAIALLK